MSAPVHPDPSCSHGYLWRVESALQSAEIVARLEQAGWHASDHHGLLWQLSLPPNRVVVVTRTARVQVRVDVSVPPERRRAVAQAVAELL